MQLSENLELLNSTKTKLKEAIKATFGQDPGDEFAKYPDFITKTGDNDEDHVIGEIWKDNKKGAITNNSAHFRSYRIWISWDDMLKRSANGKNDIFLASNPCDLFGNNIARTVKNKLPAKYDPIKSLLPDELVYGSGVGGFWAEDVIVHPSTKNDPDAYNEEKQGVKVINGVKRYPVTITLSPYSAFGGNIWTRDYLIENAPTDQDSIDNYQKINKTVDNVYLKSIVIKTPIFRRELLNKGNRLILNAIPTYIISNDVAIKYYVYRLSFYAVWQEALVYVMRGGKGVNFTCAKMEKWSRTEDNTDGDPNVYTFPTDILDCGCYMTMAGMRTSGDNRIPYEYQVNWPDKVKVNEDDTISLVWKKENTTKNVPEQYKKFYLHCSTETRTISFNENETEKTFSDTIPLDYSKLPEGYVAKMESNGDWIDLVGNKVVAASKRVKITRTETAKKDVTIYRGITPEEFEAKKTALRTSLKIDDYSPIELGDHLHLVDNL